ncbi:hypothetical protein ILUMI_25574 [Ignelater luminosus]|uniref:Uncharacterized protein n=1 Tax=Ignelater luminosus TaxID=2038154 RepID=A0A8K0C9Q1_IGNLU|nr:hypothetical protein ILUMI_25574 [Ignelater luminosus]
MRPITLLMMLLLCSPLSLSDQQLTSSGGFHYDDDDEDEDHAPVYEEGANINGSEKGMYLGAPCEFTCSPKLLHVYCNPVTGVCECEKKHPVKLNPSTGCGKPKRLGEQCYYREACKYSDQHASCIQVHHNAVCQCKSGYHLVSIQKPSKRVFCAEDVDILRTDFSTLAGVLSGIAVLSGLICFVLKLFNQNRYTRPHRFGNANLAPPIFFSNDAGSRRPSLTSVHSSSSVRSFSTRRFEKEKEQKEEREMQRRFARITSNGRAPPTPSPRSTDELLPTLTEDKPVFILQVPLAIQEEENGANDFHEELPSTSKQYP